MKAPKFVFRAATFMLALVLIIASVSAVTAQEDSFPISSNRTPMGPLPPGMIKNEAISGWLSVIWGDDQFGGSQMIITLTDESGRVIPITLGEKVNVDLFTLNRKHVTISGDWDAETFSAATIDLAPLKDQSTGEGDQAAVSGSKPWVSIMCKFSDISDEPKNLAFFLGMYANTKPGLDHYWRELSYDTANVASSTAAGWFTLPHTESYYNPTDTQGGTNKVVLATDCIAAADASVNYSLYEGINMMFNTDFDNGYAWGGSRYMELDGTQKVWSTTWEPPWAYADISVIEHEMGHGFGLPHSSGMYGATYDNAWDVMSQDRYNCYYGSPFKDATYGCMAQHTISYHKNLLGWIPAERIYTAAPGLVNLDLTLEDLAQPATSNYQIVILPIEPGSNTHFYTVEARKLTGYDAKLPGSAVIIHEVSTLRQNPAQILDPDLNGNTADAGAMWTVGETFTDAAHSISVAVISTSANGFNIQIDYNPPPITDDNYEENDTLGTAYDLSAYEQTWLSAIDGLGKQYDEDWYKIYINSGYERVQINAQFTHSEGDIDIALYNGSGTRLAVSQGTVDNEYIDTVVPAGDAYYYIKVYYANAGNTYDLQWDDVISTQWISFTSAGSQDGWILEKSEFANAGATMNITGTTILIGDDKYDRQYKSILSFNTTSLSDTATIVSVWIDLKQAGITGTNPFNTHGSLVCDLRYGSFGTSALQLTDWKSTASMSSAGTFTANADGWYSTSVNSSAFGYINRGGLTQCRLRFTKDDNDDRGADILRIHSGSSTSMSSRPVLTVEFYVP